MKKIDVSLYGGKSIFGGKETKLEAVTLYCDKCETCSLYKEGKCLNIRSLGGAWCKFGQAKKEEGYTSRAQKYYSWKKKFTEDPAYGKLKYPRETYIAKIDDLIFVNTGYLHKDKETGKFRVETMLFGGGYEFITEEEFTNDLLYLICKSCPRTIMGNDRIENYHKKVIPNFLYQFKKLMPERYENFINEYSQYKDILPNWVGKYAYIKSLRDGIEIKDYNGNVLVKKGTKLICENYHNAFLPFDSKTAYIEAEISNTAVYEIKSNDEVDENTLFRD